ncbi:MAG: hypothetical protein LN413_04080 [Candidatus Thermoplasmatota archaeon]|nr:hypothetical protein [Candidatus Thermoplasmatota archaeon]
MKESRPDEALCAHEDVEFLGEDSSRNRYSRCRACGAILIHDNVKVWVIRSGGPLESLDSP